MELKVTEPGVFDADGKELELNSTLTVDGDEVPAYLHNKVTPLEGGKVAVTNPATESDEKSAELKGPFTIGEGASGWYPVLDADGKPVKKLRKDDAEAFKSLTDEEKLEYLSE